MKEQKKYLTISLLGKNGIRVNAFKNEKKNPNEPDFKGDGVAVWINTKKDDFETAKVPEVKEEEIF